MTPPLLVVEGGEYGAQVLGVGQESHDVDVVGVDEVEPPPWEPDDSPNPQSWDVAELTDRR
jgi:hypothetical protein